MEHRLSKRVEGELPILVYKRGMPVATGKIQDASKRGLFVATEFTNVRINQTIQLSFRLPDHRQGHQTLTAHVARRSDDGLGLDFDGVDNDAHVIAELLIWLDNHASEAAITGRHRIH
ncbi:PilZ domain-containing protein [Marinobacter sp. SS5-14b]|uniref:PilZ domain-containing protein n=1 Tax=Marinobacter sp. SS5-14b TaxID=3050456 RepID=UPI0026E0B1A3|nr:PilZ domain-containing protein [Marinobacter sp. SS5-14b]